MKLKLESGKEVSIKEVSLDERDEMLDNLNVKYEKGEKGEEVSIMKTPHSTITKWLRLGLEGDISDKFLMSLSFEERGEIFSHLVSSVLLGEGNASE
jgi:hypothetical protein